MTAVSGEEAAEAAAAEAAEAAALGRVKAEVSAETTSAQERCPRQSVQNAARIAKSLSNRSKESRSIARNATGRRKDSDSKS